MDYIGDYLEHEDHNNYTYSSIFTEDFPGTDLKSIHIKDYTITHPSKKEVFIPGKTFLAPAACNYYHAMVDVIGTYEFIKSHYDDINIVFGIKDEFPGAEPGMFNKHISDPKNIYTKDIHKMYNPEGFVFNFQDCHIRFEEVIFMPTRSMWHQDRMTPLKLQEMLFDFSHEELLPIRIEYIKKIKEKFQPLIKKTKKNSLYCLRGPSSSKDKDREYDESDIVKFFESKGYAAVNLESMPILEQFTYMSNCSTAAGINGSNLFNCIFMDTLSKVYIINTQKWWGYEFQKYFERLGIIVIDVMSEDLKSLPIRPGEHLNIKTVIEKLNDYNIAFSV